MQNPKKNAADRQQSAHPALHAARRVVVAVVGGTVLLVGIALLVLPGPAVIVIPAGLGILAIEFQWSRRWLRKARAMLQPDKSESESGSRGRNSAPSARFEN